MLTLQLPNYAEQQLAQLALSAGQSANDYATQTLLSHLASQQKHTLISPPKKRQMGTLRGKISVPDNFDELFEHEIAELFTGEE